MTQLELPGMSAPVDAPHSLEETTPPPAQGSVTVADLDKLVEDMKAAYADQEVKKAAATEANKNVMRLESKMVAYLKELNRENYSTPWGTPYIIENWKVNNPETNEDKKAFFDFLREKGGEALVLKYMTVNNNSLNSFYKSEKKEAEKKQELLNIPGIGAPKLHESLGFRKAK